MAIHFHCSNCDHGLATGSRHAGAKVKCPECGTILVVPATSEHPPGDEQQTTDPEDQQWEDASEPPAAETDSQQLDELDDELDDEVDDESVRFSGNRITDDGLDMTPMVDVTFLLLIFFMVTAAFSLQKSIEMPPPDQTESAAQSRTLEEIEEDDDYVIIEIHGDNTVWVNEREAPSRQEVLSILREAREGVAGSSSRGPSSLLVMADGNALHETVVMALDAGSAVGMENVRLATVDEDAF